MTAAATTTGTVGDWQACRDCLHPGWGHPPKEPQVRFGNATQAPGHCIGQRCQCRHQAVPGRGSADLDGTP